MSTARLIRQTFTVARRDFTATVFTPTFLVFLLAPLFMLSFGLVGGLGAASMAESGRDKTRIVAITDADTGRTLKAADTQLRKVYRRERDAPPALLILPPRGDPAAQARAQFDRNDIEASAVLYGALDRPTILYGPQGLRTADYMAVIAQQALAAERSSGAAIVAATRRSIGVERASSSGQSQAGFFTVFGLFFLTLLLAGQAVGTMAEERSNKVIEVLAAAVPLESVFMGKLIGMFGVALLFLTFWGAVVLNITALLPPEIARGFADVGPALGLPVYGALFFAYFTMAYLLLGAVFLGIGALAATPRELQMLSLPITIFQIAMFGLASAAAASPDGWVALAAEIFPFSSPFAMGAKAATSAELWPHFAALAWQALWVAITITIGARLFRRGVLQSAGPKLRFGRRKEQPA